MVYSGVYKSVNNQVWLETTGEIKYFNLLKDIEIKYIHFFDLNNVL